MPRPVILFLSNCFFSFFSSFILRRGWGKIKLLLTHFHVSSYARSVSIQLSCFRSPTLAGAPFFFLFLYFCFLFKIQLSFLYVLLFFRTSEGNLIAFSTAWLTYYMNYAYPNPNPNPMKRLQPMYGETPFVSYTVCVNHVVKSSTAPNRYFYSKAPVHPVSVLILCPRDTIFVVTDCEPQKTKTTASFYSLPAVIIYFSRGNIGRPIGWVAPFDTLIQTS